MQRDPRTASRLTAIFSVPHQGMPSVLQLHTDLMFAPRQKFHLQQAQPVDHAPSLIPQTR